jgi:hypothetical protein
MLPDWNEPAKLVWPPPSQPLSSLIVPAVQAHICADWWQGREERAAAQREEYEHVANFYVEQQRAREAPP